MVWGRICDKRFRRFLTQKRAMLYQAVYVLLLQLRVVASFCSRAPVVKPERIIRKTSFLHLLTDIAKIFGKQSTQQPHLGTHRPDDSA